MFPEETGVEIINREEASQTMEAVVSTQEGRMRLISIQCPYLLSHSSKKLRARLLFVPLQPEHSVWLLFKNIHGFLPQVVGVPLQRLDFEGVVRAVH